MKTIQDFKKDATLRKTYRYDQGVMTRAQWIELMKLNGCKCAERQKRNYAAEEKLKVSIDRRKFSIPWGNECHPLTKEWLNDKAKLAAGIIITYYSLTEGNISYVITKTEFDYFNSL